MSLRVRIAIAVGLTTIAHTNADAQALAARAAVIAVAASALAARLSGRSLACHANKAERDAAIKAEKAAWEKELDVWTHETDPYSVEIASGSPAMHPRQMLRALQRAWPRTRFSWVIG